MEESDQDSNTESDEDEIITSFENLLLHPRINTTSVLKRLILKVNSKLSKDLKDKFLENLKELIRVSSLIKNDKGKTIKAEDYKKLCKKYLYEKNEIEVLQIKIPKRIELIKKLSNYSVDKLDRLEIFLKSEWEKEQSNIQKFLKSFGFTKIEEFYFEGHLILVDDQVSSSDSDRADLLTVFPCSSIFLELRHVVSRITDNIIIARLELTGKEFCQLVRASIQVFELQFWSCLILTDTELDLGQMEGCKIEALKIGYVDKIYDSWSDYEDCLMKIFVAIIHCSNLIRSLRKLSFWCNDKMKDLLLEKAKEELNYIDYRRVKLILETFETSEISFESD